MCSPREPLFSNNGRFVMIISGGDTAVKICGKSSNGKWTEQSTIQHKKKVCLMTISSDNRHVVTYSCDGNVQIHSKMANGEWIKQINVHYGCYDCDPFGDSDGSVAFSVDNRHILTSIFTHSAIMIYRRTLNEEWEEHCIIGLEKYSIRAAFSVDGSHVIAHANGITKIYGLDSKDNTWKEKAHIEDARASTASISADGGHVVTVSGRFGTAKIWRLGRDRNFSAAFPCKKMELS